ncbi:MAG: hypothetical protein J7L34_08875 [Thermotogaceae bacterium]|nr:hypothetical protein [Thermotogaceae bacterium]
MTEVLIMASIIAILLVGFKKSLWDKLISMASLGTKISIMILILGWNLKILYFVDIALVILMISSAGVILIFLLIMRSGLE